jgi:hypothetical protein
MSDFEDEMDVDAPIVDTKIQFSSNQKAKRSAANLPVEAEDTLPWYFNKHFELLIPISNLDQGGEISTNYSR